MSNDQLSFQGHARVSFNSEDPELTHTGPRTAAGEYFRRFWLPVAMTEQVGDMPLALEVLSEELVLFRDLSGRLGLLHKYCSHRRASLEYGIVAQNGIRCCYHGWLYDIDGRILEVPGEPAGSSIPDTVCQGAYPVKEYRGLVFAYMGPPETMPEFPVFDTMDQSTVDNEMIPYFIDYPCNWLQVAENPMDPFHSVFLHTRVTRAHFNPAWGEMPVVDWHRMKGDVGIYLTNARMWKEFLWVRTAEVYLPMIAQPPDIYQNPEHEKFFPRVGITKWTVPVNDHACKIIAWRHFNDTLDADGKGDREQVGANKIDFVGQTGVERSYAEGQKMPGDYEAQVSQGAITVHADEHLGHTDYGVVRYRNMLRKAIRAVKAGASVAQPTRNDDGTIATMAGDVIVKAPLLDKDDRERRRELATAIGKIIESTQSLSEGSRAVEIERQVRQLVRPFQSS